MLGQFVRKRREELGLTQTALGKKCGLSTVAVGNIEKKQIVYGKPVEQVPKFETLVKLAEGLELPIVDLMKKAKGYEGVEKLLDELTAYKPDYSWFEKLGRYERQAVKDFAEYLREKKEHT